MIKLNNYITEAWAGVKKHTNNAEIGAWCDNMDIKNYTINSKGEIDVDGDVYLYKEEFDILPYKFGEVKGNFSLSYCENLISLKNCPDKVTAYFMCMDCSQLDSLEGCPKKVGGDFFCYDCKGKFTKEEVKALCKVKRNIITRYKSINK